MAASPSEAEVVVTNPVRPHYGGLKKQPDLVIVGAELERIRAEHGGIIQPEHVVEAARDAASPLHDLFEWDDVAAAAHYRRMQARVLVRVFNVDGNTPKYVSLKVNGERGYLPVSEASAAEPLRVQMLKRAAGEAENLRKRYAHLEEAADAFTDARDRIASLVE